MSGGRPQTARDHPCGVAAVGAEGEVPVAHKELLQLHAGPPGAKGHPEGAPGEGRGAGGGAGATH